MKPSNQPSKSEGLALTWVSRRTRKSGGTLCGTPLYFSQKKCQQLSTREQSLHRRFRTACLSKLRDVSPSRPAGRGPDYLGRPKRGSGNVIFWERDPAIWAERVLWVIERVLRMIEHVLRMIERVLRMLERVLRMIERVLRMIERGEGQRLNRSKRQ